MSPGEVITAYIEAIQWSAWLGAGCLGIYAVWRIVGHIASKQKGR